MSSYELATSVDGATFEYIQSQDTNSTRVFPGNSDQSSIVYNPFPAALTRFVRLHPTAFVEAVSLRWEVYSCYQGALCPAISLANRSLGNNPDIVTESHVNIQRLEGFMFDPIIQSGWLNVSCQTNGEWNVNVTDYKSIEGKY